MLGNMQHVRYFGHWPLWRRFDTINVCERCLRPPRRPNVPRTIIARSTLLRT